MNQKGKFKFIIIGEKYQNNSFNDLFNKKIKNTKVNYINFSSKINKYIINASCIVLPSYREGLSKVLLESLAIGRPIITTNVAGCSNLVKNNINGFLAKPMNSESLYKAILKFINLSNKQKIIFSKNSRKLSYKFDEKFIIKKYLKCVNQN